MPAKFTKTQPKDGDCVLHCGHLAHAKHWFKAPDGDDIPFTRPDGGQGMAQFIVECEPCFNQHRIKGYPIIRGDGRWTGDEPVIKTPKVKS